MEQLYPAGPSDVPKELAEPGPSYKKRSRVAFLSLLLFIALYLSLTGWFAWTAYKFFSNALKAGGGTDSWIAYGLAGTSAFLTVFLVKALLFVRHGGEINDLEVTADEQPQLFRFLNTLADEAGAPRPHRVFLSARVNAAVFYDLTLLNLLFPSRKNLEIGLPLVNGLNLGEMKAVLAHEFGHFRQGSMAVGRWVYVAQQIATHIIQKRDALDNFLLGLSRTDPRIAWIGWALRLIVWALRAILDTAFSLVVLAQRSLSREMEFNADRVSVMLTGSDALVHALHRMHATDDAWERALNVAGQELSEGRTISDIFVIQKLITQRMKTILDDEHYDTPPPIPADAPAAHRVFKEEQTHPPRMWSTHPPNRAREDNAKEHYIAADVDERPAWVLFDKPDELRFLVTERLFSGAQTDNELTKSELKDTVAVVNKQYGKAVFEQQYRGLYLGRSSVREFANAADLLDKAPASSDLTAALAALYPAELPDRLEHWRTVEEERANLQALYDGNLTSPDGVIRHRGTVLKRKQIPAEIKTLSSECDTARRELSEHDRLVRSTHNAAAATLGNGWQEYHTSLVHLLHYADHSEANLADAHGRLGNLWSVVIADGKVSSSEVKQLLVVAEDLYSVVVAIDAQRSEVRLGAQVCKELGTESWMAMLKEDLVLGAPDKDNIGEWLNVIDGWVNYYQHQLSSLRQETLESVLAVEAAISTAVKNNKALAAAPEPAAVPADYARLLPNSERKRQTRLGLWDRFQTADGFVPGLFRFLVAGAIVGGLLGFGMYTDSDTQVTIYNGLATTVQVELGGETATVAALGTEQLSTVSSRQLSVVARTSAGQQIEATTVDASNSLAHYVYNVAGAAPLIEWTASYGNTGERPPRYLGNPRWLTTTADFVFREPPEQINTSGDGGTRDVLAGFGGVDPQYLSEYLPDGNAGEQIVLAHASWDHADSPELLSWMQLASSQARFSKVVASRIERNPDDVIARREEQNIAKDTEQYAEVCARHREIARQKPNDRNWAYLTVRCIEGEQERDRAFIEAYEQTPDNPWMQWSAGFAYAGTGNWAVANTALTAVSQSRLPVSQHVADTLARVRRMEVGVTDADVSDLMGLDGNLDLLLALESEAELENPALQAFQLLAQGQVREAVKQAAAHGEYADIILRYAAASDGATEEMILAANKLDVSQGINANTLWVALGFALQQGMSTTELEGQIDSSLQWESETLQALLPVLKQGDINSVEPLLYGKLPRTRGMAYLMGSLALGDDAPAQWRAASQRLLFAAERPWFAPRSGQRPGTKP